MDCFFDDDDSGFDSDFELNATIHGGYSEGDRSFGNLSITSCDHQDIYCQFTLGDDDKSDQEANVTVKNTGVPGAVITRSEATNHALAALANCDVSGRPNQLSGHIAPANPSERGGGESGPVVTSRANQPLQSNNSEEVCRTSAEPTVLSDNALSTAEGITAALGGGGNTRRRG